MPRRRDSRSRTPPRSHRRSQDFSSSRISRHRSRTRSPQNPHSMSNQKPKTWKQTSHEWDSNRVYGLTLPKIVVSNRLTREQGSAGTDIMDYLECLSEEVLSVRCSHDWPARYNTIKRLAEDMVKEFRKKAPVQANQTLLTRLQALESENARIIAVNPTPNHPRRAGTPKTRSAPPHTVEDPHDEEDGAETAPFRSPLPLDEHPFNSPDAENMQDPLDCWRSPAGLAQ